jgi:hypothetical protein
VALAESYLPISLLIGSGVLDVHPSIIERISSGDIRIPAFQRGWLRHPAAGLPHL